MDIQEFRKDMPAFIEQTDKFYAGEVKVPQYKGFSGYYGSYAQKGAKASMLRLRMTSGEVTKEKLDFTVKAIQKHNVNKAHFTTCQAIQLHNLQKEAVYDIMESALDAGICCFGGGGDYPRNVMCSPLTGVEQGEYFDVQPYALAAGDFLMDFIKQKKMPRKLKVCFSNSPKNIPHATFRDLGFVARADHKFDVYSAGGLGNNPKFGVLVAEAIDPEDILYYIKAMYLTFITHGCYENRGKARTRYMQDICGGPEGYKAAYLEQLEKVKEEDLKISVTPKTITKQGSGMIEGKHIIAQKQDGLYAVEYHPVGGSPNLDVLSKLNDAIQDMDDVVLRLSPDEACYIINLTADEAKIVSEIISNDNAKTLFETSVSCIGATICQQGMRDSQGLLHACVDAVREAKIKDGALPQIHISGCPSSCGTHQTGCWGFRGHMKMVDKKPQPAFILFINGNDKQGEERMGKELGVILETDIPKFVVEVGKTVEGSGLSFEEWYERNPQAFEDIAKPYIG